jgi:hypothetical protein
MTVTQTILRVRDEVRALKAAKREAHAVHIERAAATLDIAAGNAPQCCSYRADDNCFVQPDPTIATFEGEFISSAVNARRIRVSQGHVFINDKSFGDLVRQGDKICLDSYSTPILQVQSVGGCIEWHTKNGGRIVWKKTTAPTIGASKIDARCTGKRDFLRSVAASPGTLEAAIERFSAAMVSSTMLQKGTHLRTFEDIISRVPDDFALSPTAPGLRECQVFLSICTAKPDFLLKSCVNICKTVMREFIGNFTEREAVLLGGWLRKT